MVVWLLLFAYSFASVELTQDRFEMLKEFEFAADEEMNRGSLETDPDDVEILKLDVNRKLAEVCDEMLKAPGEFKVDQVTECKARVGEKK